MHKLPFDIDDMLKRIEVAVRDYPKAAMFALAEEGYASAFEQLIACMISIRTRDEETMEISHRLFARARTPKQMSLLSVQEIDKLITPSTFHEAKAKQMHAIATETMERFHGELPCDEATLLSFRGIGPKCANLVLGIACAGTKISVDVHVWRVTNRWGYVDTRTPEQAMSELEEKVPKALWVDINRLLMPFGKQICTGVAPKCSTCPVLDYCRQVGVTKHR